MRTEIVSPLISSSISPSSARRKGENEKDKRQAASNINVALKTWCITFKKFKLGMNNENIHLNHFIYNQNIQK